MRTVFLDVDGVLNCDSSEDRFKGVPGVDSKHVEVLAEIIKRSSLIDETQIVVTSSWRLCEVLNGTVIYECYDYLKQRLNAHGLKVYSEVPELGFGSNDEWQRGGEIVQWLRKNQDKDITGFLILDDFFFEDFVTWGIADHLVQTSPEEDGGLQGEHIEKALEILSKPNLYRLPHNG